MDPKRKKIYIAVISLCILTSVGVLYWGGFFGGGNSPAVSIPTEEIVRVSAPNQQIPTSNAGDTSFGSGFPEFGYPTPRVFPNNDKFKTEVLDSDAYKRLNSYQPVDINGRLGRPDPFNSY